MRSKVAVIVSLVFVLAVGGAALAVNTRILNTSPPPDIGRANEVLVPGGAQPARGADGLAGGCACPDTDCADVRRCRRAAMTSTGMTSTRNPKRPSMSATTDPGTPRQSPARWSKLAATTLSAGALLGIVHALSATAAEPAVHAEHRHRGRGRPSGHRSHPAHAPGTCGGPAPLPAPPLPRAEPVVTPAVMIRKPSGG